MFLFSIYTWSLISTYILVALFVLEVFLLMKLCVSCIYYRNYSKFIFYQFGMSTVIYYENYNINYLFKILWLVVNSKIKFSYWFTFELDDEHKHALQVSLTSSYKTKQKRKKKDMNYELWLGSAFLKTFLFSKLECG